MMFFNADRAVCYYEREFLKERHLSVNPAYTTSATWQRYIFLGYQRLKVPIAAYSVMGNQNRKFRDIFSQQGADQSLQHPKQTWNINCSSHAFSATIERIQVSKLKKESCTRGDRIRVSI